MIFNRLYTKILFSFLAVLVIAEILVLVFVFIGPARKFQTGFEGYMKTKAQVVREIVKDKILSSPTTAWSDNTALKDYIVDLGRILGARVWLSDKTGMVVAKSFAGELPPLVQDIQNQKPMCYGGFKLLSHRKTDYYAIIPIVVSEKETGNLHVLLNIKAFPPHNAYFLSGILILGLVIALSIIPVSGLITKRLKTLRESAIRIADGDLSHRVNIRGKDEIGELAQAFNSMTEKLEGTIVSGKELTANVSHELRSPLTRIRIAEEMLREKLTNTGTDGWEVQLDAIKEDIQDLDSLIGRTLELSKLNIHESPLRFEPLMLSELIKSLLQKLRPIIEQKKLHVITELSEDFSIMGDAEALMSAFMNILENAVKFAPETGHISVRMNWRPGSLEIHVTNTFSELSKQDLLRIFDPFYRIKRAATTGSGLGLTIARKVIERHSGTIGACNAKNGLEIIVSLPRSPN
jgi:two-component system sensor histidine kinase CpxA